MMIRPAQLPQDLAVPIDLHYGAAHERLLAEERLIRDLTVVEERAALREVAVEAGGIGHLPGVDHRTLDVDEIHGAARGHGREQRVARPGALRVIGAEPHARPLHLVRLDRAAHGLTSINS